MTTNKKLSITGIEKQHTKQFSNKQKHILKNGDYIIIETKFKKTSIMNFITDFYTVVQQLISKEVDLEVLKDLTFVQLMLYLKHFTNLDNIPADVEKMVIVCQKLIDLELLDEIMDLFDKEELDKVNIALKEANENKELSKLLEQLFTSGYVNELKKENEDINSTADEEIENA